MPPGRPLPVGGTGYSPSVLRSKSGLSDSKIQEPLSARSLRSYPVLSIQGLCMEVAHWAFPV